MKLRKEYLFALCTVLLWSSQASCCKMMMGNLSPMAVLFYTSGFASAALFVINVIRGHFRSLRSYTLRDYSRILFLGFIGIFLYTVLYYIGLDTLTSQTACIINYLWPSMIILFSCLLLKEKMTVRKGIAMLCAFLGTAMVSLQNGTDALLQGSLTGVLACLGAAVSYGFFSVMNKKYAYDQWILQWMAFTLTAVLSGLYCACTGSFGHVEGTDWCWLAWIGAMGDGVAYVLWGLAVNGGETAKVSILAYLTPFMALVFGRLLLQEHISLAAFGGLLLIIGGVLVQMKEESA